MNVRLTKEQEIRILNADDVYRIMQQILLRQNKIRKGQEYFWVVGLDTKNNVLFVELISIGANNRVHVPPPEVFRIAIYKLATKAILVHNHPGGSLKISKADKDLTDRLLKAGKLIEIEVMDHLIITEKDFYSFANNGIMEELARSGLYELVEREKGAIKEMRLKIEREKAEREKTKEIAQRLVELGMDESIIKEATGLPLREIRLLSTKT